MSGAKRLIRQVQCSLFHIKMKFLLRCFGIVVLASIAANRQVTNPVEEEKSMAEESVAIWNLTNSTTKQSVSILNLANSKNTQPPSFIKLYVYIAAKRDVTEVSKGLVDQSVPSQSVKRSTMKVESVVSQSVQTQNLTNSTTEVERLEDDDLMQNTTLELNATKPAVGVTNNEESGEEVSGLTVVLLTIGAMALLALVVVGSANFYLKVSPRNSINVLEPSITFTHNDSDATDSTVIAGDDQEIVSSQDQANEEEAFDVLFEKTSQNKKLANCNVSDDDLIGQAVSIKAQFYELYSKTTQLQEHTTKSNATDLHLCSEAAGLKSCSGRVEKPKMNGSILKVQTMDSNAGLQEVKKPIRFRLSNDVFKADYDEVEKIESKVGKEGDEVAGYGEEAEKFGSHAEYQPNEDTDDDDDKFENCEDPADERVDWHAEASCKDQEAIVAAPRQKHVVKFSTQKLEKFGQPGEPTTVEEEFDSSDEDLVF